MARPDSLRRRLTGWLANLRRRFFGWITVPRTVALLLGLLGVLIAVGGYLLRYCPCQDWPNLVAGWEQLFLDFYANVATTLVGITTAVLTIDLLNERRAEQQLKAQLVREMGSTDNGIALRAVRELRAHGWIEDGSLRGADLRGANLEEAPLEKVQLQGAPLYGINLQKAQLVEAQLQGSILNQAKLRGASCYKAKLYSAAFYEAELQEARLQEADLSSANGLTEKQLVTAASLRHAIMPNGSLYDGRFSLSRDVDIAHNFYDVEGPTAMADFYGVPLGDYLAGQEWARENLAGLRREAGLEPEEAVETVEASQPEEPQSVAPRSTAPPSPVVPTRSLFAFTVHRLIGRFWPFGL